MDGSEIWRKIYLYINSSQEHRKKRKLRINKKIVIFFNMYNYSQINPLYIVVSECVFMCVCVCIFSETAVEPKFASVQRQPRWGLHQAAGSIRCRLRFHRETRLKSPQHAAICLSTCSPPLDPCHTLPWRPQGWRKGEILPAKTMCPLLVRQRLLFTRRKKIRASLWPETESSFNRQIYKVYNASELQRSVMEKPADHLKTLQAKQGEKSDYSQLFRPTRKHLVTRLNKSALKKKKKVVFVHESWNMNFSFIALK